MGLGPPIQALVTIVRTEELQTMLTIEKCEVSLLLNTGAHFSDIPFSPGPRSPNKATVQGLLDKPLEHYFTQPLACS
jgi:hypothetical protein